MRTGFTGTGEGMTDDQKVTVYVLVAHLPSTGETSESEAHHGYYLGAD